MGQRGAPDQEGSLTALGPSGGCWCPALSLRKAGGKSGAYVVILNG